MLNWTLWNLNMGTKINDIQNLALRARIQEAYNQHVKRAAPVVAQSQAAKPEQAICNEPLGSSEIPRSAKARFDARFYQFTRSRQDPDNACPKYHIDWLRSKGLLPDDTDDDIELTIRQIQVEEKEDEGVLINIKKNL